LSASKAALIGLGWGHGQAFNQIAKSALKNIGNRGGIIDMFKGGQRICAVDPEMFKRTSRLTISCALRSNRA
jgi:hypothetical protein